MSNGQDNEWAIYLVAFAFILFLVLIAITFKVLVWVGIGMILLGFIFLIIATQNNNDTAGIWGLILLIGGFVAVMVGFTAYDWLKEVGVIDFLKNFFNSS